MTAADKYLKAVRKKLICPRKSRDELLNEITPVVREFSDNYPDAAAPDYVAEFGTPEAFAKRLLDMLEQSELADYRRKRVRSRAAIIFAAVAVAAVCFFIYMAFYKNGDPRAAVKYYVAVLNIHDTAFKYVPI